MFSGVGSCVAAQMDATSPGVHADAASAAMPSTRSTVSSTPSSEESITHGVRGGLQR